MPIYEYKCNECGKNFEYLVMGNKEPENCPSCNSEKVKKLVSSCGFFSKGSGGETVRASAGTSSCGSCSAMSCSSCGV